MNLYDDRRSSTTEQLFLGGSLLRVYLCKCNQCVYYVDVDGDGTMRCNAMRGDEMRVVL